MTSNSIKSIHDLLNEYRELIQNKRDLGTSFERLVKSYLETDPIYKDLYPSVSMWTEWEHCWGPDCGIDLVAEDKDGEFVAIQCKFYDPQAELKKEDINSFIAESGRTFKIKGKSKSFAHRLIFSTCDNWSVNAENTLKDQSIPVTRIRVADLDQSPIDWSKFSLNKPEKIVLKEKKKARQHQEEAISKAIEGFKSHDRGKLIMACGTGKTFTALKLTERFVKKDGVVLFLVPSISLLSQTLREWTAESEKPFHAFAVCSDSKVGKDSEDISKHELLIPASTDTKSLIAGIERAKGDNRWIVIFSTYQSIDVVSQAQKKGLPEFDLVICDEAHRTTGVTLSNEDESHFVKVHDQKFIKAAKRLYMTATPRVFGDAVKTKASEAGAELCSMDDMSKYGPEFYRLGFGKAVSEGLLTDYKVLILAVDEKIVPQNFQKKFANEEKELKLDDITKIIGCWNGLSKRFIGEEAEVEDGKPMKRAVAFARSIIDSRRVAEVFQGVVKEYIANSKLSDDLLDVEVHHVDGSFNVLKRNRELDWLKADTPDHSCRILSNARCLSEGVDVPALDAVLFLNSRDSQVDVVQSVGRIMRRAEGKKYGYIILPVGIPAGVSPDEALKDNKKYKVVWQILQALRAHDDRFDAMINQMDLNKNRSPKISIIGVGGGGESTDGGSSNKGGTQQVFDLPEIEAWRESIYAKIVLKCGSRPYWENWAADVAKIAERHTDHIKSLLKTNESKPKKAFEKFLQGIRKNINPSISETEAIEMLSQHLITKPVFDALFEHYPFAEKNPVSRSMQEVLKVLESASFKEDAAKLKSFYDSVRMRVKGIDNPEGRQKVIVELYDRFFKVAFPKMSERLGIVYTPVEVVDFIINSIEAVLKKEFGKSISDKGVQVLDPFTGTGTFIVRLLQSGIIKPEDLVRKFTKELHANEIVLLAYYIAAINIEETYHGLTQGDYTSIDGLVLTDTFQQSEEDQLLLLDTIMPDNIRRLENQKKTQISVIIGNPPYSFGQTDVNDNNQNLKYPKLDDSIRNTYAKASTAKNKNSLYDSYFRALRWASNRIGHEGVIGFVINGSFIDGKAADGVRKSLLSEFSSIYCLNLRGNQYTSGEKSQKEGGKIFGSGSRAAIAILILIKNPKERNGTHINYFDIGDYLTREEKLSKIKELQSIQNVNWGQVFPSPEGDWINRRNIGFEKFLNIYSEENKSERLFEFNSNGVATSRDPWVLNFSKDELQQNIKRLINNFNEEVLRYSKACKGLSKKDFPSLSEFVVKDQKKIAWSSSLLPAVGRGQKIDFHKEKVSTQLTKPFCKQFLYFDALLVHRQSKIPQLFPEDSFTNKLISITGLGVVKDFSVIITANIPASKLTENAQIFPLYYYIHQEEGMLKNEKPDKYGYVRREAITDWGLKKFQEVYNEKKISKEDIFFYIYSVLHSTTYRENFENDLKKMLPRVPLCKDFWGFSKAGRDLSKWHLEYETIKPYDLTEEIRPGSPKKEKDLYRVDESGMKWPKVGKVPDKTKIIFNGNVTLSGIPVEAYDYIVNGKSALEWIMERYCISVDLNAKGEGSGIKNDPNEWSEEPRYIVDLVKRIVRVSIETNKIVKNLPALDIISDI